MNQDIVPITKLNAAALKEILDKTKPSKLAFIGLGNNLRNDDGAGLYFLFLLKKSGLFKDAGFIAAGTNPENYLEKIINFKPVSIVFIDTVLCEKEPGEIFMVEEKNFEQLSISTHNFSLSLIKKYLDSYISPEYYFVGIQPGNIDFEDRLSPQVSDGILNFFKAAE